MNYSEQEQYLRNSHAWAAGFAVLLLVLAVVCLRTAGSLSMFATIAFGLIVAALAISLSYTPDYLHVTSNPGKAARWEVRVRWRILGAVLVLGLLSVSNVREAAVVALAIVWLVCANLQARATLTPRNAAAYFWLTDVGLLMVLLPVRGMPLLLGAALLAVAVHLSIVICQKRCFAWAALLSMAPSVLLYFFCVQLVTP